MDGASSANGCSGNILVSDIVILFEGFRLQQTAIQMALKLALKTAKKSGQKILLDRGKFVPVKSCVVCNRDFTWRKKWERCWEDVTTCSKRCNRERRRLQKREKKLAEEKQEPSPVGGAAPKTGQKNCDLFRRSTDLLIRCIVTAETNWVMVCGKCWNLPTVANGVVDGDSTNPHYRYGGLWKNRRA